MIEFLIKRYIINTVCECNLNLSYFEVATVTIKFNINIFKIFSTHYFSGLSFNKIHIQKAIF